MAGFAAAGPPPTTDEDDDEGEGEAPPSLGEADELCAAI